MKTKNVKAKLDARIKAWEASGGQNKYSGHKHIKPGSENPRK